jgi:hypothetical protein
LQLLAVMFHAALVIWGLFLMTINVMTMKSVPNRPAISNVLIKASANVAFQTRLLTSPKDALAEMNLPPEDVEILARVQAPTLSEYARQVKVQLLGL